MDSQIGRVVAGEVKKKKSTSSRELFCCGTRQNGAEQQQAAGLLWYWWWLALLSLADPKRRLSSNAAQHTRHLLPPRARARARFRFPSRPRPSPGAGSVGPTSQREGSAGSPACASSGPPSLAVRRSPRTAAVAGGGDLLMGGAIPAAASCAATSESDHGGSERARCWPGLPFLRAPLSLSLSSAVGPPRRRRADETVHPARPAGATVFFTKSRKYVYFHLIISMKNNKKE